MKKRIGKITLGVLGVTAIAAIGLMVSDIVSSLSLVKELENEDEFEDEETMDEDILTKK